VGGLDFNVIGGMIDACLPIHDPVALRVERKEADLGRKRGREIGAEV
jgi:hypothetical protein